MVTLSLSEVRREEVSEDTKGTARGIWVRWGQGGVQWLWVKLIFCHLLGYRLSQDTPTGILQGFSGVPRFEQDQDQLRIPPSAIGSFIQENREQEYTRRFQSVTS